MREFEKERYSYLLKELRNNMEDQMEIPIGYSTFSEYAFSGPESLFDTPSVIKFLSGIYPQFHGDEVLYHYFLMRTIDPSRQLSNAEYLDLRRKLTGLQVARDYNDKEDDINRFVDVSAHHALVFPMPMPVAFIGVGETHTDHQEVVHLWHVKSLSTRSALKMIQSRSGVPENN